MARGVWSRARCHHAIWKDALKANPAGVTHTGAVDPDGWFQRSLSHEPQRLSGSVWAIADHSHCWAEGNQVGAERGAGVGAEQGLCLSAAPPHLCEVICNQIILVSPHNGLGVPGCMGTKACLALSEEMFWHHRVLWCCRTWTCLDRRQESLGRLSFLWGSGESSRAVALC